MDDHLDCNSVSTEALSNINLDPATAMKEKLKEIIDNGKSHQNGDFESIKNAIKDTDTSIILLGVQAVSELAKCDEKRLIYAQKDIIEPVLNFMKQDLTSESKDLLKSCCRCLGNLCYECDQAREIIFELNGISILLNFLSTLTDFKDTLVKDLILLVSKVILNYMLGGIKYCDCNIDSFTDIQTKILNIESSKTCMNEDLVSTTLSILSILSDVRSDKPFNDCLNVSVLNILKETTSVEVSDLSLDHLLTQAEHDSVKTLIVRKNCVELLCDRLELFLRLKDSNLQNNSSFTIDADENTVMMKACDLIIIILTGDEAMEILYGNGKGTVYKKMGNWLTSDRQQLQTTAILAFGNFARRDDYCIQMMESGIFDKILDILKADIEKIENAKDMTTSNKVQNACLSSLRNLLIPVPNKKMATEAGKIGPLLMTYLPKVKDHVVAYKLLAVLRMLVDGQEEVARAFLTSECVRAACAWGVGGAGGARGGAACEAARLLAWAVRASTQVDVVKVDGCISCLVSMLVSPHSIMQNEALLALTLIGLGLRKDKNVSYKEKLNAYNSQLVNAEIGKHISVLLGTNTVKMPIEMVDNLTAFLDLLSQYRDTALSLKQGDVGDGLRKLLDSRSDVKNENKVLISSIITRLADLK